MKREENTVQKLNLGGFGETCGWHNGYPLSMNNLLAFYQ